MFLNYIFNLKKDRLKQVYEEFQDNVNYKNETTKVNYKLSCCIRFKGNVFNALSYQEEQNGKIVTFNYITNLPVNNYNIEEIIKMGSQYLTIVCTLSLGAIGFNVFERFYLGVKVFF